MSRLPIRAISTIRSGLRTRSAPGTWLGRVTPSRSTLIGGGLAVLAATAAVPLTRACLELIGERRRSNRTQARGLDSLTGLPNRAEAIWWLPARLEHARSRGARLALLMLDLDDFADCNEVYGRMAGDHVLQVTAVRLQEQLRTGDLVCRSGSDTFMMIIDVAGPDHLVSKVAERVVAALCQPISFSGEQIEIGASIGFAISQNHDRTSDLLLDRADRALIQAKASSRRVVQF